MHKSLEKFIPYVESGLVRQVISPCGKLVLWNYTDKCTYEKTWDDVTLNARGTVYEIETGKVIARSFPKFFNFGELPQENQQELLKNTNFKVYEKMDGSLGIIYYYNGEWRVNTRGSFTSDQAVKGKQLLNYKYDMSSVPKEITLLVEIIYPENKIIVDYGNKEELVILSSNGRHHKELPYQYEETGMKYVPSYAFNSISELQTHLETLDHNEEGYVVQLNSTGDRVKFKSAEYLALARIMSNMSPLTFWEKMEYGKIDREFLEQLPEEFRDECDKIADKLEEQYADIQQASLYEFSCIAIDLKLGEDLEEDRKTLGLYLKKNKVVHAHVMFPYLLQNGPDRVEKYIMKQIKPVGNIIREV